MEREEHPTKLREAPLYTIVLQGALSKCKCCRGPVGLPHPALDFTLHMLFVGYKAMTIEPRRMLLSSDTAASRNYLRSLSKSSFLG